MAKKPAKTTAGPGHNGSGLDETQEAVFIREFQRIKAAEAEMAGTKGELGGSYKRLESAGFTKDHIKWAFTLEKTNVSEVIRDLRMKISIAKLMGHAAGRQLDLIDDRTPLEDQAYLEGIAAGKLGREATNPYGMETAAGQNWQKGMNEGNVIRNAALNEAMNSDAPQAEVIRGPGDEASAEGDVPGSDGDEGDADVDAGDGESGAGTEGQVEAPALDGEILPPAAKSEEEDWDEAAPVISGKSKTKG